MTGATAPKHRGLSRDVMVGLHMQVTANLVRALGGNAAAACVLVMIQFRTQVHGYKRMDGTVWWKSSMREIARDTGLSPDQVNRLLAKLTADGYVLKAQHYLGIGDPTTSYRIVFDDGGAPELVTENPSPDPLWITPPAAPMAESPDAGQTPVAIPPEAPTPMAESPEGSGGIATTPLAIPPSLPIRSFPEEEEQEEGGEGLSPWAVDNFAPSRPLSRPDHCADHQNELNPPPCPGCAEARRAMAYTRREMITKPCLTHGHVGKCPHCPGGHLHHLEDVS